MTECKTDQEIARIIDGIIENHVVSSSRKYRNDSPEHAEAVRVRNMWLQISEKASYSMDGQLRDAD